MTTPNPLRRRTRIGVTVRTPGQIKSEALAFNSGLVRAARAAVEDDDTGTPTPPSSEDQTVGELWLYGLVGGWWRGFDAESVAAAIRGMDVDVLHVRIHSPGGRADEGIAIANLLRNHKAHVVTVVDGKAASAASVIAVAGDEVVMCPGSQLMLHDASTGMCVWGDAAWLRDQTEELTRVADWIDGQSQNYAGVYAYKAGGTAQQWRDVMTANGILGTWYTAEEAVAAKLADRVGTIVAAGSPPVAPEDDFDDDDEEMLAKVEHDLQLLEQCVAPAARLDWQGETYHQKPPTASAGGSTQPEGAAVVDFNDEQITALREQIGFPADADAETIVAAVSEALGERAEETSSTPTPQIPEGMALVDSALLAQVQSDAAAGRTAATTLAVQDRDSVINKALADGKIAAASRDKFVEAWDKEVAAGAVAAPATRAILDALTPGVVPTAESGHESEPSALGEGIDINDAELDAFAASLGLNKEALRG